MRWLAALLLLIASTASGQMFPIPGHGRAVFGGGGGGGGVSGVEGACTTSGLYGSGGNCMCSEMMNESFTVTGPGVNNDPPGSPNTWECWKDNDSQQTMTDDQNDSTVSLAGRSGWGTLSYALQSSGHNVWGMYPTSRITSSTRTLCGRYYKQYLSTTWDNNGNGCRTKLFEYNFGSTQPMFQPQLRAEGGTCVTTPTWHSLTGGGSVEGNYDTTVYNTDCDDKPCKVELCVDGNISTGQNLQGRFRITSYEGAGKTSTVTTPVGSASGGPSNVTVFGFDVWHSSTVGGEDMLDGLFSVWAWDTDTDQWPPNDSEINP